MPSPFFFARQQLRLGKMPLLNGADVVDLVDCIAVGPAPFLHLVYQVPGPAGLLNLLGIESPDLTAALAIGACGVSSR